MITGHGNDRYLFGEEIKGDFSSNIAYRNHSDSILEHLHQALSTVCNYPDPKSESLTGLIAQHHDITPAEVLVTSGSAEAFYLIAHRFAGAKSVIGTPAFSEYEDACRLYGHDLTFVPLSDLSQHPLSDYDTVWWGTPNNPDGRTTTPEVVSAMADNNPETHLIIDCAYAHLSEDTRDLTPLHSVYEHLVTIHSLTKAFDIPGLRLGYIIADASLIEEIRSYQIPWSVNTLAQEAGIFIMEHYDTLLPDIPRLIQESKEFQSALAKLPRLEITPSTTNYFLVRMTEGSAADLKQYLIHRHGLLIRDASNFRGLTPQHFRLAVQAPETNRLLIEAIKQYFHHHVR